MKESTMIDEIANQDIENIAKGAKSSEEAMEVVKEIEKIISSNKHNILWLAYQKGQTFEIFKLNDNFINMVNKFRISKSTLIFKISIKKFLNKYPRIKKLPLSLHFLNNSFKIIKEIFRKNDCEFK